MPTDPSPLRDYFRFRDGEKPSEVNLNAGMIDKIDADMQDALDSASANESGLADLKARVDQHADGNGDLIQTPPEFAAFAPTPTYISTTQFSVVGNFTQELLVNRRIRATLTATTPLSHIQTAVFDGGSGKTTVTLFDAVLNNTLSAVELGFIKEGLPKITASDFDFAVGGDPVVAEVGATGSAGTSKDVARKDHRHAIPAGAPAALSFGGAAAPGTSELFPRADHVHALPALPAPPVPSVEVLDVELGFPTADSTSEEVLYSYLLPANALENADAVFGRIFGKLSGNTGGSDATLTLRLTFDGVLFLTLVVQTDQGAVEIGDNKSFCLEFFLLRAPGSLQGGFKYEGPYANSTAGVVINGSIVENRTAIFSPNYAIANEIRITGQWSSIDGTPEAISHAGNLKIER